MVGRKKVLEMVLTGDTISASEALALGLVNKVVPKEQLEAATMELAGKLAAKSPLALQAGKRGIYMTQDMPYEKGLDVLSGIFASICSTEDAEAGVQAFLEKKQPVWKGR
jgi:enoyl-CoA hydratase/carnithine racemase